MFFKPKTVEEALSLLAEYGCEAMIVNGGTDAVLRVIEKKAAPKVIVHVADIAELKTVKVEDGQVVIGGSVTYNELEASPAVAQYAGLLKAIRSLASPQIRVLATPAGNICNAATAADCSTMLTALGAKVHLVSAKADRWVALNEFFVSAMKSCIACDELLTEIAVPCLKEGAGTGYMRLSRRKAQDISNLLVGAVVRMEAGVVAEASISVGAVNANVIRASQLEKMIEGKTAEEAVAICKATFPAESSLREDYFKAYKEAVACDVIAATVEMAINDAKGAN